MAFVEHEEAFVRAFIRKECQERYLYLLASPKRRKKLHSRLQDAHGDLKPECMLPVPKQFSLADIESHLRKRGADSTCHVVLSAHPQMDASSVPLSEALQNVDFSNGALLSCIPGVLAYYVGEFGMNRSVLERK